MALLNLNAKIMKNSQKVEKAFLFSSCR